MSDKQKGRGAHGTGERLNRHDSRIANLSKQVNNLKQRVETAAEVGDIEMSGKKIKLCLDNDECYVGKVVAVSKFKIKLAIESVENVVGVSAGAIRTFNKGKIRWHEEL